MDGALPRITGYLKKWANEIPEQPLWFYHDVPISYQQVSRNVQQVAKYMLKMGVKKGERLAYIMNGRPEFFTYYWAAASIGAIVVGINTRYTAPEIAYILNNSGATHLLSLYNLLDVSSYQDRIALALKECPSVEQVWISR